MDLNDLTIGQAKALVDMFGKCKPEKDTEARPSSCCGEAQPVIVCTDKRGVVFGYTTDVHARPIQLTEARMCLYWSADVGGVFGLAEGGPTKDCKISAVAPSITLGGVTAIFTVDDKAVKAWKSAKVQGR